MTEWKLNNVLSFTFIYIFLQAPFQGVQEYVKYPNLYSPNRVMRNFVFNIWN